MLLFVEAPSHLCCGSEDGGPSLHQMRYVLHLLILLTATQLATLHGDRNVRMNF